mgnify:CR=1 FL=1
MFDQTSKEDIYPHLPTNRLLGLEWKLRIMGKFHHETTHCPLSYVALEQSEEKKNLR